MTPGLKLDLPSAAPRRAAKTETPACENCRGRGYIPLGEQPEPNWGSAAGLAAALERGACCLCTCAEGRWWLDWFAELAEPLTDRDGRPVRAGFIPPTRGIPEFAERVA